MMRARLKPVLPSLREKKRYMVFEVISKSKFDFRPVSDAIMQSSLQLLGQLGVAKAGIIPLENKWNKEISRGIIKVGHKHVDALRASLALIRQIGNQEVIVRSLGVSGMINKVQSRYLN